MADNRDDGHAPFMMPDVLRFGTVRPQAIEQTLAVVDLEAFDVSVSSPAQRSRTVRLPDGAARCDAARR